MENLKDPEVQSWFAGQNDYTRAALASIPGRAQLLARIQELSQSVPFVIATRLPGDLYLIEKKLPTEDVPKMYLRSGLNGKDRFLADPERITLTAANQSKGKNGPLALSLSDDGRYAVVGITPGGAENNSELHVIEIATGRETGDVISRGGPEFLSTYWLPDNRSFVYRRLQILPLGAPATELDQKKRAYLHVLGTDPDKDPPVFGYGVVPSIDVDPILPPSKFSRTRVTRSATLTGVTPNSAYYIAPVDSIGKSDPAWRKVADFADGVTNIAIHDDDLYLLTYKDAQRYKIIRTDARKPDLASAETVVPASQAVIQGMSPAQDALYVRLLDGGLGRVLRVRTVLIRGWKKSHYQLKVRFFWAPIPDCQVRCSTMTSWTQAFKIYAYDPETKQATDTKLQPLGPYDNPTNIESAEVQVRSYDGTLVPLSIMYPKGLKLDGTNPTLLEGYGSYGWPFPPYFESTRLAWHEKGGVYAVCHVRGGGEYGEEWHLAGKGPRSPIPGVTSRLRPISHREEVHLDSALGGRRRERRRHPDWTRDHIERQISSRQPSTKSGCRTHCEPN